MIKRSGRGKWGGRGGNNNDDSEAEEIKTHVEGKNEQKEVKKGIKSSRRGKDEYKKRGE
jgi:hypothetical protein